MTLLIENPEFIKAMEAKDVDALEQLWKKDSSILEESWLLNGNNIISWAAVKGHAEVVKLLLVDGRIDPAVDNNYAIQLAAANGHAGVVELLLADKRVQSADKDNNIINIIRIAAENGHADVVKLLLAYHRVNPAANDNDAIQRAANNYAIQEAAANGHADVVKLLLDDRRADPAVDSNYAIRKAARDGHAEVVKLLLADDRINPAANDNNAIQCAADNGHADVVKLLLDDRRADRRADPTADNNYAIKRAAANGDADVVKLLLDDRRADPAVDNNYAIQEAAANGHAGVVELLLADKRVQSADKDNNIINIIRIAAENGHADVVKLLLAYHRVNPAANDNDAIQRAANNYAIGRAAANGHAEVVKLLLADDRVDPLQLVGVPKYERLIKYKDLKIIYENLKERRGERLQDPALKKRYNSIKDIFYNMKEQKDQALANFNIKNKPLKDGFEPAKDAFNTDEKLVKFSKHTSKQPYSYIRCTVAPEMVGEEKAKCGVDSKGQLVLALINGNILGKGGFARVKLAMNDQGELFAVRVVSTKKEQIKDGKIAGSRMNLRVGEVEGEEKGHEVMYRVEGDELAKLLKTEHYRQNSKPHERLMLFIKTLDNLNTKVHSQDIRHDDLKPANILGAVDIKKGICEATIIDADRARVAPAQSGDNTLPRKVGTPRYQPPEAWEKGQDNLTSDIYSMGLTGDEILGFLNTVDFIKERQFNPELQKNIKTLIRENAQLSGPGLASALIEYLRPMTEQELGEDKQFVDDLIKGYDENGFLHNHQSVCTHQFSPDLASKINNIISTMTNDSKDERYSALEAANELIGCLEEISEPDLGEDKEFVLKFISDYKRARQAEATLFYSIKSGQSLSASDMDVFKEDNGNINARDAENSTPLMNAVDKNNTFSIKALLDAGANPDVGAWTKKMKKNWVDYQKNQNVRLPPQVSTLVSTQVPSMPVSTIHSPMPPTQAQSKSRRPSLITAEFTQEKEKSRGNFSAISQPAKSSEAVVPPPVNKLEH